jgi:hypothetical protein
MQITQTPKANPENLLAIVGNAFNAEVVIPEFQRSFVWGRENIEELLVSILQNYFIGTFLMLDTSVDRPISPFRPVEGLNEVSSARPDQHGSVRIVLDGQQRVTSLFYVLYEPSIPLKGASNPYRFYFRIDLALDGSDLEDAAIGVSLADRRRLNELDNLVREYRAVRFSLFRDSSAFYRWLYSEQQCLKDPEHRAAMEVFYHRFADFMIPVVDLSRETRKDNIVNIFERINRTGVSLSLFDLAVARVYTKGIKLRDLWRRFEREHRKLARAIKPEFLLKLVTLFKGKEPKRGPVLDVIEEIDGPEFLKKWEQAAEYMVKAYQRVTAPSGGYGAVDTRWIPYSTMLVPIAALLRAVEERGNAAHLYSKLDRWYWASVLSHRYDQAVDTRTFDDVRIVTAWLDGAVAPPWLASVSPQSIDPDVDEPRSALYRGLMCLVVLHGARDFINGQQANLLECHDDHIFPRSKFGKLQRVNSILNRTLISKQTNEVKGNRRPSEYLPLFLERHGNDESRLLATLSSHMISTNGYEALKDDDLGYFLEARRQAFLGEVQRRLTG